VIPITFQDSGLQTAMPFCDRLETRDFQNTSTPEGLNATLGINVAFDAFMTATAEVDYDTVFGDSDIQVDDAAGVCSLTPLAPHSSN
jgi:hypothetical protein